MRWILPLHDIVIKMVEQRISMTLTSHQGE